MTTDNYYRKLLIIFIATVVAVVGIALFAPVNPEPDRVTVEVSPLPPAEVEPTHTTETLPGDVSHAHDRTHGDPVDPAATDGPVDPSAADHGEHHWGTRVLTFVDYTGGKHAEDLAAAVSMWNGVRADVRLEARSGGEVRYDCGTAGTAANAIPVCLANTDDYLGWASWGPVPGHIERAAIQVQATIAPEDAAKTVAHEVGHVVAFARHGGGCVMEQTRTTRCDQPSDADRSELARLYNHCAPGDCLAPPAITTTTASPPAPPPTTTVPRETSRPADPNLAGCRRLHASLHTDAQPAARRGVSVRALNDLNRQLHTAGCR